MTLKILVLTRYGCLGASSRLRTYQFIPVLKSFGIDCTLSPLIDDTLLSKKYLNGNYPIIGLLFSYLNRIFTMLTAWRYDFIWIEKEALPWFPAWLEKTLLFGRQFVLDFDDAIFHNYDLHPNPIVKKIWGKKIDSLMAKSAAIFAGNDYLAKRAEKVSNSMIYYVPTVVDIFRYSNDYDTRTCARARIVWIGSPSTVKYLDIVAPALQRLAMSHSFTLRVIGAQWQYEGIQVECLPWNSNTEVKYIAESDIGIMPLADTPWEHGKCAYKLIQYMACGLPTVCSPIGANEVVVTEQTGFFAYNEEDWFEAFQVLLGDETLRRRLGNAGLERVNTMYSLQVIGPVLAGYFKKLNQQ